MWTKTAPTVPGFYWYRYNGDINVVYLWKTITGEREFSIIGTDDFSIEKDSEFWSEPLQVPE